MKKTFISLIFVWMSVALSAQLRTGMTFGGGTGYIYDAKSTNDSICMGTDYKFNVSIGYKFRIQPVEKRFFYDIDLNAGLKRYDYYALNHYNPYSGNYEYSTIKSGGSGEGTNFFLSLNPSFNYRFYKGLNAGVGLEPTAYYLDGPSIWRFDIPITARIGYDFKFMEIGFGYKLGMTNVLTPNRFTSGKLSDWQFQIFIPF